VLEELSAPGPFLALSHGDAESNNILVRESGPADARLIDFEAASYAHALLDAVSLHVPGPEWTSVGDPAANGLADEYRRAHWSPPPGPPRPTVPFPTWPAGPGARPEVLRRRWPDADLDLTDRARFPPYLPRRR
jgi:hypothetical protein